MNELLPYTTLNILLADDDLDDCIFFKAALKDLSITDNVTDVHNGEELMQLLTKEGVQLPDVLFLDLNMHRKNGFECLEEIKANDKLKNMPVIIFSTSFEPEVVNTLYNNGAQFFIRKPAEFSLFKLIIQNALTYIAKGNISQPTRENFVLSIESSLLV